LYRKSFKQNKSNWPVRGGSQTHSLFNQHLAAVRALALAADDFRIIMSVTRTRGRAPGEEEAALLGLLDPLRPGFILQTLGRIKEFGRTSHGERELLHALSLSKQRKFGKSRP